MSTDQLEIDATTTVRDIIDSLTEDEQGGIRSTLGNLAYQDFLDQPLIAQIDFPEPSPFEYLPVGMIAEFAVAGLSGMVGVRQRHLLAGLGRL